MKRGIFSHRGHGDYREEDVMDLLLGDLGVLCERDFGSEHPI